MESGQPSTKHRAGPLNHVSKKKHLLTRSEPLKPHRVPLSELSSSKTLINLIKKDQSVLQRSNLAQLTKMQPRGIYKGYKLARKSLKAYSIKMQYEIVFKSDRLFMLYLPSSYCSCCCSNWSEDCCSEYWYWGSSGSSTSTHKHMPKQGTTISIQANTNKKLRNSTSIHKN